MKIIMLTGLFVLLTQFGFGQETLKLQVRNAETQEPLEGVLAAVKNLKLGGYSDAEGRIRLENLRAGTQTIEITALGFLKQRVTVDLPVDTTVLVMLEPTALEIATVTVEATRTNRSIADLPTRVEVLTEEIDEAMVMDASKIAHLITHSTGVQVQQTSAVSGTANVRIQGLDGRYAQILKDGFPLYGGFSGSLSIMQIPPLDLRQVEYIKGSASTLYGGGAISGLINLLTKEPDRDELTLHLNASHIGALDMNGFASRRYGKAGFTVMASRNTQKRFDADGDGYTDVPEIVKYNINPKMVVQFDSATKLTLGATFTNETRAGGDVRLVDGDVPDARHFYQEKMKSDRITTQVQLQKKLRHGDRITLKNGLNFFTRTQNATWSDTLPAYAFGGRQISSFSEASYALNRRRHTLVVGANIYSDDFIEERFTAANRNETNRTAGLFAQHTWTVVRWFTLESGFRGDYHFRYGAFPLPRVSALWRVSQKVTARASGGMGYRAPTMFNSEAEQVGFRNVRAINSGAVKAERSYGGNFDFSYKTPIGRTSFFTFNQMFFYNRLVDPLIFHALPAGEYQYQTAAETFVSRGYETQVKVGVGPCVLFVGYTYTEAKLGAAEFTLTPTHSLKGDLLFHLPGKWRAAVDYEFKSEQRLADGRKTPAYVMFGAMVERTLGPFTLFGNWENFTDRRQTRYESMRSAPYGTPQFTPVWAPLDGFVFNAGVKISL